MLAANFFAVVPIAGRCSKRLRRWRKRSAGTEFRRKTPGCSGGQHRSVAGFNAFEYFDPTGEHGFPSKTRHPFFSDAHLLAGSRR